ncbi:hypothetical protein BCV02_10585 [Vibrio breoganii]|uniref:Uncharacterized protein n=1 Tax=Vibrio breoganii TaxID=553239 RepID=A0AAP8MTT7_9VIBR|nr:hypothetical protein BCV02_10585 [Vibrio breoganii]PMG91737.1 hypothetical protein BCU81_05260 [Vibrio breoganii]PML87888.1 hypothetical protein BCT67_00810 [Vibrio breoganii]PMO90497.1 hypothetical protein BCS98_14290 [Vibrio breoganii]PMP07784.1 hypothetical protein BCS93_15295 [Vibrio breoganii]
MLGSCLPVSFKYKVNRSINSAHRGRDKALAPLSSDCERETTDKLHPPQAVILETASLLSRILGSAKANHVHAKSLLGRHSD